MVSRARRRAAGILLTTALLGACTASVNGGPTAEPTLNDNGDPGGIVIEDPWIKATDEMMTGAFGTLRNDTERDVHVVSATSPLTDRVEIHEVLSQGTTPVMSEMPDGFLIPAGGTYVLERGGAHVMLMMLSAPIEAGEDVEITLHFEDGTSLTWQAPARTYSGAGEAYMGDGDEEATEEP